MINCAKTIWILATNALDKTIISFCDKNQAIFDEDNRSKREDLLEELTTAMREEFISVFKVSILSLTVLPKVFRENTLLTKDLASTDRPNLRLRPISPLL